MNKVDSICSSLNLDWVIIQQSKLFWFFWRQWHPEVCHFRNQKSVRTIPLIYFYLLEAELQKVLEQLGQNLYIIEKKLLRFSSRCEGEENCFSQPAVNHNKVASWNYIELFNNMTLYINLFHPTLTVRKAVCRRDRLTVGQIRQKCKETSNLMRLS